MIAINPKRRNELSNEIRLNFKSLPGQNYFDKLTDRLARPYVDSRLQSDQMPPARSPRRVRIRCKWSELVASPIAQIKSDKIISQLMRRRLSKVLEEETEFSTEDDDISPNQMNKSTAQLSYRNSFNTRLPTLASCDNFQLILQELRVESRRSESVDRGFRLVQQDGCTSTQPIDRKSGYPNMKSSYMDATNAKPKCYELFTIHKSGQLVHRNQPLIEAERLAKRLIELTSLK